MKILVVSDLYPPFYIGGYEINCKDAVEALIQRGHQVTVLTSTWGVKKKSIQDNIYRLLEIDTTHLRERSPKESLISSGAHIRYLQIRRIMVSQRNYSITRKIIEQIQPDVVYLWHLGSITISPALSAKDLGIPSFFRIEDYSLARIKQLTDDKNASTTRKWYRSIVFGKGEIENLKSGNFLFISQSLKNYYIKAGFSTSVMDVVPSGLSASFLHDPSHRPNSPFSFKEGKIRLVFAGRIQPEKGPDIAVEAVAQLQKTRPNTTIYLDIIGKGNSGFEESLKMLSNRLGISDRVNFLGKLQPEDVLRLFQQYDALLFTSRWREPFGRVIIEAMAQGLPVIAANNGAAPEIISDGENGLLIPPDSPEALANAINSLLMAPDLAIKISRNAFDTIRSCFTLEKITLRVEEYISQVVMNGRVTA